MGCRSSYINQEMRVSLGSLSSPHLHIGMFFAKINFFLKRFFAAWDLHSEDRKKFYLKECTEVKEKALLKKRRKKNGKLQKIYSFEMPKRLTSIYWEGFLQT